jgi:hydrogenase nickel incorporation protein HypA/HybF
MHEFSIAQSLISAVVSEARRAGAERVNRVVCRIGALRMVDDLLMQEAFSFARDGTICADCELVVERTYMEAYCPGCRNRFPVRDWQWHCPDCGAEGEDPRGGDELELVSLDVEVQDGDYRPEERIRAE